MIEPNFHKTLVVRFDLGCFFIDFNKAPLNEKFYLPYALHANSRPKQKRIYHVYETCTSTEEQMHKYTKLGKYCATYSEVANEIASYLSGLDKTAYSLAIKASGWSGIRSTSIAYFSAGTLGFFERVLNAPASIVQYYSFSKNHVGVR